MKVTTSSIASLTVPRRCRASKIATPFGPQTQVLEGNVSKRLSAPYRSWPSRDRVKVKNPSSPAMIRARDADGEGRKGAMRSPLINYGWLPIDTAPLDEDIALQVTDGRGGPYTLQWPCRRTATGWINSRKPAHRPNRPAQPR
jgi:hypothetical protein